MDTIRASWRRKRRIVVSHLPPARIAAYSCGMSYKTEQLVRKKRTLRGYAAVSLRGLQLNLPVITVFVGKDSGNDLLQLPYLKRF